MNKRELIEYLRYDFKKRLLVSGRGLRSVDLIMRQLNDSILEAVLEDITNEN